MYDLNHRLEKLDATVDGAAMVIEINKFVTELRNQAETDVPKVATLRVRAANYMLAAANTLLQLGLLEETDASSSKTPRRSTHSDSVRESRDAIHPAVQDSVVPVVADHHNLRAS